MKKSQLLGTVCGCFLTLIATSSEAATITFGSINIDHLQDAGIQTEAGFQYKATGIEWEIVNTGDPRGNPPSALATRFNGLAADIFIGDTVVFSAIDGGLFNFIAVDTRSNNNSSTSDLAEFTGFLNGNPVGVLALIATDSYSTTLGFEGLIDSLVISVTELGDNAFWVDNLNLEAATIPLPASIWLFGSGLLGLIGIAKRKAA